MNPQKLLEYFTNRRDEIVNSIVEIVEIESPSYDISGSRNVVDFLEKEARKIFEDFQIERIFAENYGEHFILRAFPQSDEKPILLLGHTDTVHPRGTKTNNPTRIEAGKLYGCGTFDMKANVVLMFEILRAFAELNLKPTRPITILLSCDEEVGSFTGREIVEREAEKSEFCLVCEPSANGNKLTGTHLGRTLRGNLEGTVTGERIRFRSTLPVEGTRLIYDFEGTLSGDRMSGEVACGEYGRAQWTAKRQG